MDRGRWRDINRSGTVPEIDVPYRVLETIDVRDGAVLTIARGVEFHMIGGVSWDIGWNSMPATIIAVGSAAKPIKSRGVDDQPGFWHGISIGNKVATTSRLEYVEIGNAGTSKLNGNLRLYSPIAVSNCRIYGSAAYGGWFSCGMSSAISPTHGGRSMHRVTSWAACRRPCRGTTSSGGPT